MIARIVIPLLLVIVLSDLYIDVHYFRRRYSLPWWLRLLWWVPCIALSTYTITLASLPSFAPSDLAWLNTYLLLLGFFVGPKAIFALCSFLGSCLMRLTGWPRINLGHYIGILLGCGGVLAYIYGLTVGVRQVKVNHLTLQFDDLPAAFDGYKILHISDLHLGTFYGWRQKILQAEMDSIARQHADLMVFTGDVQNIRPQEIFPHTDLLRSTTQGMVSVLGNHDYASYAKDTHEAQDRLLRLLVETEQNALGWRLLRNDHLVIRRGGDSLVVAGTENDGEPPFPNRSFRQAQSLPASKPMSILSIRKTLRGRHLPLRKIMADSSPSPVQTSQPHSTSKAACWYPTDTRNRNLSIMDKVPAPSSGVHLSTTIMEPGFPYD